MVVSGIRRIDFTDQRTNNRICGYRVYFSDSLSGSSDVGLSTDSVFLSDAKFDPLLYEAFKQHSSIEVVYNKYGKAQAVKIL